MMGPTIRDEAHLRTLPDGTIISWLRIPGDRSSEAVAFVRREVEPPVYEPTAPIPIPAQKVTVWISPGGWDPHTIESAGVTFPCEVVRWGEFTMDTTPAAELPMLAECMHGGTWAREKALECASQFWSGQAVNADKWVETDKVLTTAEQFETWLERE
jgi:hypothetical protein